MDLSTQIKSEKRLNCNHCGYYLNDCDCDSYCEYCGLYHDQCSCEEE